MGEATVFRNADGSLSVYALACGHIMVEQTNLSSDSQVTLWAEGDCYHLRHHDHQNEKRVFWNSYQKLTLAKRDFRRVASDGRHIPVE